MEPNIRRRKHLCVLFLVLIALEECGSSTDVEDLSPYLGRQYKLKSSDNNLDKIMKGLGVKMAKRNAAKLAKPILTLTEDDEGRYTFKTHAKVKTFSATFRIGEPFEQVTPDGRRVTSTYYQDKNVLTEIQEGDQTLTIVHIFSLDEIVETIQLGTIVTYRTYKCITKPPVE